jgi:hypothetical protein
MTVRETDASAVECLATAGLPAGDVREWLQAEPGETTDFPADGRTRRGSWGGCRPSRAAMRASMPPRARFKSGRAMPVCGFFAATAMPSMTR